MTDKIKRCFPGYHIIIISNISHYQYHFHPLPHFFLCFTFKNKMFPYCILLRFASFEMFSAIFIPIQFKFTFQPSLRKLFLYNNNILYSSQWEIKTVVQSHNKDQTNSKSWNTSTYIRPFSLNLRTLIANPKLPGIMLSLSNQNVKTQIK